MAQSNNPVVYGRHVRSLRIERGLSLRDFCLAAKFDPGNWSRVERGILPPPKSNKVRKDIAAALSLEAGSVEAKVLADLADLDSGLVHAGAVLAHFAGSRHAGALPMFFRDRDGFVPSESDLDLLVKAIREAHTK